MNHSPKGISALTSNHILMMFLSSIDKRQFGAVHRKITLNQYHQKEMARNCINIDKVSRL